MLLQTLRLHGGGRYQIVTPPFDFPSGIGSHLRISPPTIKTGNWANTKPRLTRANAERSGAYFNRLAYMVEQ